MRAENCGICKSRKVQSYPVNWMKRHYELCLETGGAYFPVRADNFELLGIYEHMEQRRQQRLLETRFITQFEERYQYFLLPALVFLIIEMLMSDRKKVQRQSLGGYRHSDIEGTADRS